MGDAPALRIECGSCQRNVEVPRSLLEQVLQLQQFQCPSCQDWQRLNLDPATMQQLWASHQRASPASQLHGGHGNSGSLNGHSRHSDSYYQQLDYSESYDMGGGHNGGFARPVPAVRDASPAALRAIASVHVRHSRVRARTSLSPRGLHAQLAWRV